MTPPNQAYDYDLITRELEGKLKQRYIDELEKFYLKFIHTKLHDKHKESKQGATKDEEEAVHMLQSEDGLL